MGRQLASQSAAPDRVAPVINYKRNDWWRNSFALHGTILPRVLGRVGLLTALCLSLCVLDEFVLGPAGYALPALDQLGHTVLGIAMSMLIVFRTNTSYNRYWDGRTYWGALINGSRNLARLASTYAAPADEMAGLISAYVVAVRANLRGDRDLKQMAGRVSGRLLQRAQAANNPPTAIAAAMSHWIHEREQEGVIDRYQAMTMEQVVNNLVDNQGGCERIQTSPLPFVYAVLIKQLLLLYLVSLPFVLVSRMGFAAPLVVAVVSLGMLGIEEAGIMIESPFDDDSNSLPLDRFCTTVARDTAGLCSTAVEV